MKYLYLSIVLLMLALQPTTIYADNETSYLAEIDLRNREVSRKNRQVKLKMVIDLSKLNLRTQHTVALTPVVVAEDGKQEQAFPSVVIDGKTRNRMYLRAQRLKSVELPPYHDEKAKTIIRRKRGKTQCYEYEATLPYARWMLDGRIEIREQVSGCTNCMKGWAQQLLPEADEVLAAYYPQYQLNRMEPTPEPIKVRAETRTARLQFRQNSHKIDPKFKNNQAELDTVTHSIEMVKTDPDLTITGIYITGYASPEGTVAYNQKLSQTRAEALAAYVQKDTQIATSLWHVKGMGEDWDELRKEVLKHPRLLKIEKVLDIIDHGAADLDTREESLKALVPPDIYQRLINEMYGPIRRNEYRIEYNVRSFNIKEAKQQIHTRPELLSVEEIYKVADSYNEASDEYREAMLIAACTYPDNVAAVVNAARTEMKHGHTNIAIKLLEEVKTADVPEVLNALGVAYAQNGLYDKAKATLQRAKTAGSKEAANNLQQLEGVMNDL